MKENPRTILEGRPIVCGDIDGYRKIPFVAALFPLGLFPNIISERRT
jgi:hypothetical protein